MSGAANINSLTLAGNLTSDPVLRTLPDGRSVCDMRLAVNDERGQPPLYIDVATFGASAEACAKYLTKGRSAAVTGRLLYREWEAEDGNKRSSTRSSAMCASAHAPTSRPTRTSGPRSSPPGTADRGAGLTGRPDGDRRVRQPCERSTSASGASSTWRLARRTFPRRIVRAARSELSREREGKHR